MLLSPVTELDPKQPSCFFNSCLNRSSLEKDTSLNPIINSSGCKCVADLSVWETWNFQFRRVIGHQTSSGEWRLQWLQDSLQNNLSSARKPGQHNAANYADMQSSLIAPICCRLRDVMSGVLVLTLLAAILFGHSSSTIRCVYASLASPLHPKWHGIDFKFLPSYYF